MGFFDKLKKITTNLFSGFSEADEAFFEELEETLILADLGMDTALDAVEKLRTRVRKEKLQDQEAALRDILAEERDVGGTELDLSTRPAVVLFIGVNGVGKTTSIGKLGYQLKSEGKRVLFCAADTFRAAAADQLQIWAERAGCELVRQHEGADPGAVLFDALQAAKARGVDVVLCDTAGRLHNKANLMAELAKLSKIIDRECPGAARETLLVLDATTGQNGLIQARHRHRADEAGWHGQGRHRHRHRPGAGRTGEAGRCGRGGGRPEALRREGICGGHYLSGSRETRITIWNRRELISVSSQQMYFRIRGALSDAGLSSGTRTRGLYAAAARRSSVLTYTIYVHRDDYDRAFAAIQSSLRGK